jgi:tRNA pseudouridine32 synthase/23S rRNA pseudouridine746 synthase
MTEPQIRFEKRIEITQKDTVAVDIISEQTVLSKQAAKQAMLKGAVWLVKGKHRQRLRRAKKLLKLGEVLHVYYDKHILDRTVPEPTLVFDAGTYSVWNKPYGLLSQGSEWGDHCTIVRWAEQYFKPQREGFVVHRLDRDATGLILVAHTKQAASALSNLFQQRQIDKRYRITVSGDFSSVCDQQFKLTHHSDIDQREAVSHFTLLDYDSASDSSILDVDIETGRKHQIRRHSAELGFPIVGDKLYGEQNGEHTLQLNAYFLSFVCPTHKVKREFNLLDND